MSATAEVAEISVTRSQEPDLDSVSAQWSELHARSGADPVFMSWAWQSAWWACFGPASGLELLLLEAFDSDGRLVGLAPLFRRSARRLGIPVTRIELIGNIFLGPATMRSEYLDFLVDERMAGAASRAILAYLRDNVEWDELIISDLDVSSPTFSVVVEGGLSPLLTRCLNTQPSYCVDTCGRFSDYKGGLSASARRRFVLQRDRLERRGRVDFVELRGSDFEEGIRILDRLHERRWGGAFFDRKVHPFHRELLARAAGTLEPVFNVMRLDGHPISVFYDLRADSVRYNVQGGFDAAYSQGLSVAKLHWGYVIESAFDSDIRRIDLMVGGGRKENFKREFATIHRRIATLQAIRPRWLKLLYRLQDAGRQVRRRALIQ